MLLYGQRRSATQDQEHERQQDRQQQRAHEPEDVPAAVPDDHSSSPCHVVGALISLIWPEAPKQAESCRPTGPHVRRTRTCRSRPVKGEHIGAVQAGHRASPLAPPLPAPLHHAAGPPAAMSRRMSLPGASSSGPRPALLIEVRDHGSAFPQDHEAVAQRALCGDVLPLGDEPPAEKLRQVLPVGAVIPSLVNNSTFPRTPRCPRVAPPGVRRPGTR